MSAPCLLDRPKSKSRRCRRPQSPSPPLLGCRAPPGQPDIRRIRVQGNPTRAVSDSDSSALPGAVTRPQFAWTAPTAVLSTAGEAPGGLQKAELTLERTRCQARERQHQEANDHNARDQIADQAEHKHADGSYRDHHDQYARNWLDAYRSSRGGPTRAERVTDRVSNRMGCGSFRVTWSEWSFDARDGVIDVSGFVDVVSFLSEVVVPVGLEVAVGFECA